MTPSRDTLQRIGSINGEVEKMLAAHGVNRFTQIAGWGPVEIERFDRLLGSQGRVTRENWVEQAQILAKGGDTAHSREYDRRLVESQRDASVRPKSITEAIKANASTVAAATAAVTTAATAAVTTAATAAVTAAAATIADTPAAAAKVAPLPAPVPSPARADIAGLRSVRSDAYRPAQTDSATAAAAAAVAATGSAKVVRSAEIDDL